jgi:hypothetical protein
MFTHPDIARFLATERQGDRLREAEDERVVRHAEGTHTSGRSRLRGRLLSRDRRRLRPARAS